MTGETMFNRKPTESEIAELELLVKQARQRLTDLEKRLAAMQDVEDNVRLGIQYLLFDLEATRRENAEMRKMLERLTG